VPDLIYISGRATLRPSEAEAVAVRLVLLLIDKLAIRAEGLWGCESNSQLRGLH